MRSMWDGPIVIKGIQTVADAVLAADAGVEAIALSNHGGRQLDSAPAIVDLVAPVADAVGDRIEIICDGGVRRGSDIVKAVALGARACMAGRAYLYGLGAAGERGVDHVLKMLEVGCAAHHGAPRGHLYPRAQPRVRVYALAHAASPARRVWRAIASTRPSGPHMVASSTAKPSRDRGERHER